MNKVRRAAIAKVVSTLQEAQAALETLRDEEQEYYDNMPESFQDGDKGEAAQQAVSSIEDALTEIESAANNLESIE